MSGISPFYDAFLTAAQDGGARSAIAFGNEDLSFEQMLARVENTASRLSELGIGRGTAFAVFSANRPEIHYCFFAAAKLGAVFVPLNPILTASEVEYSLRHSGAVRLFYDDTLKDTAVQAAVSFGDVAGPSIHPIDDLVVPCTAFAAPAGADVSPDDDFLVIYTSGTTGTPKGIVFDHQAQAGVARSLAEMWDVSAKDTTLVALPMGYLYGLSTAASMSTLAGARIVVSPRFRPQDVLEAMVAHAVTVFHGVPTMYSMMLEYCEERDLRFDLSGVRELICAGAPLSDELRRRFFERFGQKIQNYYAMSECTPIFGKYATDPKPIPEGAIGRLAPGAVVSIRREDGSECDTDEEGEFLVRAPGMMNRYLNDPDQTAAVFEDGMVHSGDLGYRDALGYFYISGRKKDVIIRGGANISPSEVEGVLATHPDVHDVAVVGAKDEKYGEVPVAFVVLRKGAETCPDDLREHAATKLSEFKVPTRYYFRDELPQGKTGKVDKAFLKSLCSDDPPRNPS